MQAEELFSEIPSAETLSPTVDAYDELVKAYDFYNQRLFNGDLPGCLFTFQRNKRLFGFFSRKRFGHRGGKQVDEIAMNPSVFAVRPVEAILSTLVHEQCHQWQACFGKPGRRGYHNAEWADKMEEVGLIPSSHGRPGGKRVGEHMTHYIDPNGRFMALTKELLESGFALSWYDRFPTAAELPIYVGGEGEDDLLADVTGTDGMPLGGEELKGVTEGVGGSSEGELPSYRPASPLSASLASKGLDVVLPGSDETKKGVTTRAKFICPGCADAAWGKPSLNIICGKCKTEFKRA